VGRTIEFFAEDKNSLIWFVYIGAIFLTFCGLLNAIYYGVTRNIWAKLKAQCVICKDHDELDFGEDRERQIQFQATI